MISVDRTSADEFCSAVPDWEVCRMCGGSLLHPSEVSCAAVFVSLNNGSIVSFCCFLKILQQEARLKFKVRGREISRTRQTFQSGCNGGPYCHVSQIVALAYNKIPKNL